MATATNAVKATGRKAYHHGGLRAALLAAGMEIIEEVGPDAFSLRAAARRAGVSEAAPAHHFGNTRGLVTAIATIGFTEFGDAMEQASIADRKSPLRAQCHAYVHFAIARPGLFRLMWRKDMLDGSDCDYIAAARRAFAVSDAAARPGGLPAEPGNPALTPTIACWAMVHGFAGLVIDGASFAREAKTPEALGALLDAMLAHLDMP